MTSTLRPDPSTELRNVAVVLRFSYGDFDQGFRVFLQIYNNGKPFGQSYDYNLPPLPELGERYRDWAEHYENLGHQWRKITAVSEQVTNHASFQECNRFTKALRDALVKWFEHDRFETLNARIQSNDLIHQDRSVPIVFDFTTPDPNVNDALRKIPWHLWQLFEDLDQAEVAISVGHQTKVVELRNPVRILAVLGGEKQTIEQDSDIQSDSIQAALKLEEDKDALRDILHAKNAVIKIIEQPTTEELHTSLKDEQGWDIFFFTGHSTSDLEGGSLLINENHAVSLDDLKEDFRFALRKGLKLAIFNSCKGLGIADFFAGWTQKNRFGNLNIPNLIVMREAVPDFVARDFFKEFLQQFVAGNPIYKAVRNARGNLRRLQSNETRYPCASWVPVIALSPSQPELYWPRSITIVNWKRWIKIIVGISIVLLFSQFFSHFQNRIKESKPDINLISADKLISSGGNENIEGGRLLSGQFFDLKQQGMEAFRSEDYLKSRDLFSKVYSTARSQREQFFDNKDSSEYQEATAALQDPEVLIYRNNAEVRLRRESGEFIYRIAAVVPLTDNQGNLFDIGREMLYGIAQAQDKAVWGKGYEQKNLEVLIANDRNDPMQAAALAKTLVEPEQEILAIVGHYLSASTCKALEAAYDKALMTVISPLSTATGLRGCGPTNQFFRNTSSTKIEARTLINHLVREKGSSNLSIGIFYREEDDYSEDLFDEFRSYARDKEIDIAKVYKLGHEVFNAEEALNGLQDVDALVVIPDGRNSGPEAFNQALSVIEANAGQKMVLGSNSLYNRKAIDPAGGFEPLKDKLFTATDWHKACAPLPFVKETEQEYWLGGVNRTTTLSYEAMEALLPTLKDGVTSIQISNQLNDSANPPQSSIFKNTKTISFNNGNREELKERIITTVQDEDNPFILDGECP